MLKGVMHGFEREPGSGFNWSNGQVLKGSCSDATRGPVQVFQTYGKNSCTHRVYSRQIDAGNILRKKKE